MRFLRGHALGVGVALTAALTALACSKGGGASAARTRPPPLVVVGKVAVRDVPVEIRAPVDLRPIEQADVGSKTLGVLDTVFVDRGDHVRRGQTLALVRPSDLPDQLATARGVLAQTNASLGLAQTNYDRAKSLAPSGVVSQQELQAATAALATAQAAQGGAQSQVSAIGVRLGELRIDSPMDGVVAARKLDPGAMVGLLSGATIITIARVDVMRVFVTVTERDSPRVHVGQEAHVELDAMPGRSFVGRVMRMAPEIDPSTRTLDAEVQLRNEKDELHVGMYGHAAIVVEVHPHVPVVPSQAVLLTDGKAFVYVLAGEKVQRRAVELGVDGGTWLEILRGVGEGDEVVTAGSDVLSDGSQVRVTRDVDPYSGKLAGPGVSAPAAASAKQD